MKDRETIEKALALAEEYSEDEELQRCFIAGYDHAICGANDLNCNFRIFSTTEKTQAWETGSKAGEEDLSSLAQQRAQP